MVGLLELAVENAECPSVISGGFSNWLVERKYFSLVMKPGLWGDDDSHIPPTMIGGR